MNEFNDESTSKKSRLNLRNMVLVLYVLPVAEYTGICCGYLTTSYHQASPDRRSSEIRITLSNFHFGY
ncbi:hypothetical protein F383_37514 [Gossypium arboreum]|uniref:Uncharacterized protein n=1 Tax=Gossypium arboreum TaxID=29729 RepID=A0A0B0MFY7_GOSAR|nr:hypothetical protein F383_37514 [Gossypium arboreum]